MKTQHTIRLDPGIAWWLTEYGAGSLVEGVRRVAREMQVLNRLEQTDPGMPIKGAFNSVKQALASLGVGKQT